MFSHITEFPVEKMHSALVHCDLQIVLVKGEEVPLSIRTVRPFILPIIISITGLHSRSLVCAPGMHFLLTFVVHSAWTLLRSVSNHICFLLLTLYNNFFYLSNCLLLCI